MKTDTIVIAAAAALGLWFVSRVASGKPLTMANTSPSPTSTGAARATAIPNPALPGQSGWGWQYFTDGTSIGPDGRYYQGGAEVYNPLGILGISQ